MLARLNWLGESRPSSHWVRYSQSESRPSSHWVHYSQSESWVRWVNCHPFGSTLNLPYYQYNLFVLLFKSLFYGNGLSARYRAILIQCGQVSMLLNATLMIRQCVSHPLLIYLWTRARLHYSYQIALLSDRRSTYRDGQQSVS